MVRPTDPSAWLFATVRTLLHRIEVLEGIQTLEQKPFSFNPKAPVYFPHLPPGLHHAVSENFDFACLFHYLYYNVAADASVAIVPKLLDDAIQRDEAVLRVSDAIEPKLLDDVIQRAEALRVSDAIEPKLFDDAIQRAEAVARDWKFPADNLVEPEISFEYWKFSDEVSDVPSPNNFIQFIDDNTQDAANNIDARSNPQLMEYIQQTQVASETYCFPSS